MLVFQSVKWAVLKEKRKEARAEMDQVLLKEQWATRWVKMAFIQNVIMQMQQVFEKEVHRREKKALIKLKAKLIIRWWRRRKALLEKSGKTSWICKCRNVYISMHQVLEAVRPAQPKCSQIIYKFLKARDFSY
jgi:hypothetical protein